MTLLRTVFSLTSRCLLLGCSFLLSGCGVHLLNLTPGHTPKNPSGIYPFSMQAKGIHSRIPEGSIEPYLVIDGKRHPMKRTRTPRVYALEHPLPKGTLEAPYYFTLDYSTMQNGNPRRRHFKSSLQHMRIIDKYVSLEVSRGLVGSEIALVGRGFSPEDTVRVGGRRASTHYASRNSISFTIPYLPVNQRYPVELISEGESIWVGTLSVDPAQIALYSEALSGDDVLQLISGQDVYIEFEIETPAPKGGLPIEVSTDIPNSLIMPEVLIPEGATQVSVLVRGDDPASGSLFLQAPGYNERSVALRVSAQADAEPSE